jgi:uncharacterized protein YktB (UPF0637 family)
VEAKRILVPFQIEIFENFRFMMTATIDEQKRWNNLNNFLTRPGLYAPEEFEPSDEVIFFSINPNRF